MGTVPGALPSSPQSQGVVTFPFHRRGKKKGKKCSFEGMDLESIRISMLSQPLKDAGDLG